MNRLNRNNTRGFTLIETVVAVSILAIGMLSTFMVFLNAGASSQLARDTILASTYGDYILEEMYARPDLAGITETNWQQWAFDQGLDELPQQTVTVTYQDVSADPLHIGVKVGWERKDRSYYVSLTTELTK